MNTSVIDATSIDAPSTRHTSTDAATPTPRAPTPRKPATRAAARSEDSAASAAHLSDPTLSGSGASWMRSAPKCSDDLGESDARYIRRVIAAPARAEVGGRGCC